MMGLQNHYVHYPTLPLTQLSATSLGFSPFELVFGHVTWGPLKFLKEAWLDAESSDNVSIGGAP